MKTFFALITILFISPASGQVNFHWRQISGPVQSVIVRPDSSHTNVKGLNVPGVYEYELSVFFQKYNVEAKDSVTVTVLTGTVLAITPDSLYHIERPEIKKLEIKAYARAGDIFIQIKSPKFQHIECALYDIAGRKLAKIDLKVNKGINFITVPKPRVNGVYILRFNTYFETVTEKIFIS